MQIRSIVRAVTAAAALGLVAPTAARAQTITSNPLSLGYNAGSCDQLPDQLQRGWRHAGQLGTTRMAAPRRPAPSADVCAGDIGAATGELQPVTSSSGGPELSTPSSNKWYLWAMDLPASRFRQFGMGVFDSAARHSGSPDSSSGNPSTGHGSDDWNSRPCCSPDPVGINGAAPVGDLWGTLTVSFGKQRIESCPDLGGARRQLQADTTTATRSATPAMRSMR